MYKKFKEIFNFEFKKLFHNILLLLLSLLLLLLSIQILFIFKIFIYLYLLCFKYIQFLIILYFIKRGETTS